MLEQISKIKNFFVYLLTFLIIYQLYFPVYSKKHLTVALVLSFILFCLYIKDVKLLFEDKAVIVYILLLLTFGLRGAFSQDKLEGIKYILYLGSGLIYYFVYSRSQVKKENIALTLIISILPMVFLMIYTYHNEQKEFEILRYPIMKFLIDPSTIEAIFAGTFYPNIYETQRVGGFFTNANTCSIALGLNIILILTLLIYFSKTLFKKILLIITSLIIFVGIIYTGSKGAIVAFAVSSGISGIVFILKKSINNSQRKVQYLLFLLLGIFLFSYLISKISPRKINQQETQNFHGRDLIWKASLEVIKKNWLFGTGLSGKEWSDNYNPEARKIGASENTPPHNIFLYVWGKTGIFSVIFLLLFFILKIFTSMKNFYVYQNTFSLAVLMATLWILIQGMVENFVLMDLRISAIYWLTLALERKNDLS
ncbi:MAG: O-antigen ligase family protein [Endomicrobiia bacterium]